MFPDSNILQKIELFCINNELGYIDGVTTYCEKNNLEIEVIAALIKKDPVFTAKMQVEAENLNFVKKSGAAKLPS